MTPFKLDSNIPIPEKKPLRLITEYPFNYMGPGQSFFVAVEKANKHKVQSQISGAASQWSKRARKLGFEIQFSTRTVEGGIRVWRVK